MLTDPKWHALRQEPEFLTGSDPSMASLPLSTRAFRLGEEFSANIGFQFSGFELNRNFKRGGADLHQGKDEVLIRFVNQVDFRTLKDLVDAPRDLGVSSFFHAESNAVYVEIPRSVGRALADREKLSTREMAFLQATIAYQVELAKGSNSFQAYYAYFSKLAQRDVVEKSPEFIARYAIEKFLEEGGRRNLDWAKVEFYKPHPFGRRLSADVRRACVAVLEERDWVLHCAELARRQESTVTIQTPEESIARRNPKYMAWRREHPDFVAEYKELHPDESKDKQAKKYSHLFSDRPEAMAALYDLVLANSPLSIHRGLEWARPPERMVGGYYQASFAWGGEQVEDVGYIRFDLRLHTNTRGWGSHSVVAPPTIVISRNTGRRNEILLNNTPGVSGLWEHEFFAKQLTLDACGNVWISKAGWEAAREISVGRSSKPVAAEAVLSAGHHPVDLGTGVVTNG